MAVSGNRAGTAEDVADRPDTADRAHPTGRSTHLNN